MDLHLDNLTLGYPHRPPLLSGATATLRPGRLAALIGRNGSGKSTLLRVIAGMQAPQGGRVTIGDADVARLSAPARSRLVSFVTTARPRVPSLRCSDLVAMGRAPYTGWAGSLSAADRNAVDSALAMVGMQAYARRTLLSMSDGECQRVMIARALAQDTPVILLDEPTSFLDLPTRHEVCALLGRLARDRGKLILFSTHELDIARTLCDDLLVLDGCRLHAADVPTITASGVIDRLFAPSSSYL